MANIHTHTHTQIEIKWKINQEIIQNKKTFQKEQKEKSSKEIKLCLSLSSSLPLDLSTLYTSKELENKLNIKKGHHDQNEKVV